MPLVRVFMFAFAPVTWPVAAALDRALGRDLGTLYSQQELKRLMCVVVVGVWGGVL